MAAQDIQPKVPTRNGVSPLMLMVMFPLFIAGILFLPTSILIILGMFPTMACALVDRSPQRYATITVGLMNTAGIIPHLVRLWVWGENMQHMLDIISDPLAWLTMYGTATFGWFLFFALPPLVQTILNQRIKLKIASLDHKQNAMVREWGEEIRLGNEAPNSQP